MSEKQPGQMDRIEIDRGELLSVLRENKEKHDGIFQEASEQYWGKMEEFVSAKREAVKLAFVDSRERFEKEAKFFDQQVSDREEHIFFNWSAYLNVGGEEGSDVVIPEKPKSFAEDYEKAIRKVELSVSDTLSLDNREFDCFVMNNWDWKDEFLKANTQMYMVSGSLH